MNISSCGGQNICKIRKIYSWLGETVGSYKEKLYSKVLVHHLIFIMQSNHLRLFKSNYTILCSCHLNILAQGCKSPTSGGKRGLNNFNYCPPRSTKNRGSQNAMIYKKNSIEKIAQARGFTCLERETLENL